MTSAYECLCRQTVSIYRRQGTTAARTVVDNCFLQIKQSRKTDVLGQQNNTAFLLIIPGDQQSVQPGDRVLEGIGPQDITWQQTGGFPQVEYVQPCCWQGKVCHTEAGRKE